MCWVGSGSGCDLGVCMPTTCHICLEVVWGSRQGASSRHLCQLVRQRGGRATSLVICQPRPPPPHYSYCAEQLSVLSGTYPRALSPCPLPPPPARFVAMQELAPLVAPPALCGLALDSPK